MISILKCLIDVGDGYCFLRCVTKLTAVFPRLFLAECPNRKPCKPMSHLRALCVAWTRRTLQTPSPWLNIQPHEGMSQLLQLIGKKITNVTSSAGTIYPLNENAINI